MPATHVINVDLARVTDSTDAKFLRYLAWGDFVEVTGTTSTHQQVKAVRMVEQSDGSVKPVNVTGLIKKKIGGQDAVIPTAQNKVLKVNFVDVQQGDGSVIETPGGKIVLIDGGDNQLFARYLAARYRGTSKQTPREIDCVLVTHGDADHFLGLAEIQDSETHDDAFKRLFIKPLRVYHNGLVKRPEKIGGVTLKEHEMLGATTDAGGKKFITGLEENLTQVNPQQMNMPFKRWQKVLKEYERRYSYQIDFKRLQFGDDARFDFLKQNEPLGQQMKIEVLGPLPVSVGGQLALPFLGEPDPDLQIDYTPAQPDPSRFSGFSASHTINGHSVIIRLTYGGFRFLFAGDLNAESEAALVSQHGQKLSTDVLKGPHHGSADFSVAFISASSPIISVISSGDESSRKEYIHPRASMVGALGKHSRVAAPLIFVTELAAFFEVKGYVDSAFHQMRPGKTLKKGSQVINLKTLPGGRFFAFARRAFGLIKMRTDGRRLLTYTDSGDVQLKEAYAYEIDSAGVPQPVAVRKG